MYDPYIGGDPNQGQQPQSPYKSNGPAMVPGAVKNMFGGMFGLPKQQPKSKPGNVPAQPAPNSPQSTNPQLQPQQQLKGGYTPTTAPYGMDQTNPGVAEQFWNQNQNLWMQPPGGSKGAFGGAGAGQQFWNQIQGGYNQASQSLQPQFDAAFDRASNLAVGKANQQAANRGVYGSSAALNNIGNVAANIEAQRAGAASDFALKNAANQQAATGLYGNLAFGAGREAQQMQGDDLNRLNAAFAASQAAQNARRGRTQDAFGNTMAYTGMVLPWAQGQYENAFNADQNAFSNGQDARLGASANRAAQAQQGYNNFMGDVNQGLNLYGAVNQYQRAGQTPQLQSGQVGTIPSPYYKG